MRPLPLWARLVFFIAAVALIVPGWQSDLLGVVVVIVTGSFIFWSHRRTRAGVAK
jgi:UPF0716 family protein affecting phage T7 exclusion